MKDELLMLTENMSFLNEQEEMGLVDLLTGMEDGMAAITVILFMVEILFLSHLLLSVASYLVLFFGKEKTKWFAIFSLVSRRSENSPFFYVGNQTLNFKSVVATNISGIEVNSLYFFVKVEIQLPIRGIRFASSFFIKPRGSRKAM